MTEADRERLALESCEVLSNDEVAEGVYLMSLDAPRCADAVKPGQFVHLRLFDDPSELLRIPISVYGANSEDGSIELLYQVLGHGTQRMSWLAEGGSCDIIGPIGRGFEPPSECSNALLVSGGLGAAPITMLAQQLAATGTDIDIVMGAPTSNRLVGRGRLSECGSLHIATDDGSEGVHGFCTQLSHELLAGNNYEYVATCGPAPMEKIVCLQALAAGTFCEVSLEQLMACGVGACLSCVVDTTEGKKRVCVDGPVFSAEEVFSIEQR